MKNGLRIVAYILVIIGALNWGLWGFFQFDLVAWLFGGNTTILSRLIYALIGLAGVWSCSSFGRCCKAMCCCPCCGGKQGSCSCKKDGSCK